MLANGPKMRESRRQPSFIAPGGGNMASTDDGAYVEPAVAGVVDTTLYGGDRDPIPLGTP